MDSKENKLQQVFTNEAIPDIPKANNPNNRRISNRRVSFAATMKVHEFASATRANQPSQQHPFSSSPTCSPSESNPFEALHVPPAMQSSGRIVTTEVPVREDSSFSSFHSDEDERERRESLMMEFTECVGGLIAPSANDDDDASTIDFTMCVGGLIKSNVMDSMNPSVFDANNDMELTECVGGLIKDAGVQAVIESEEEEDTEIVFQKASIKNNQEGDFLTMDITACVGADLVGNKSGEESPSPFLVIQSQNALMEKRFGNTHSLKLIDEIGGIDDLVAGSPMKVDQVTMDLTQVINEAIASNVMPVDPSPLPQKVLLNEFLAESGIRFLDNVSSLTRRETMVIRARESERIRPSSTGASVYVTEAVAPELAIYEKACQDLTAKVLGQRERITGLEHQFNRTPPSLVLHQMDTDKVGTVSRLKSLKTVSRLAARQAWYEWRRAMHEPMVVELEVRLDQLTKEQSQCGGVQKVLSEAECVFDYKDALITERDALMARHLSMQTEDPQMIAWLQNNIDNQSNEIVALDAELAILAQEEAALRLQVEAIVCEKQRLVDRLAEVDALLHTATPCDELSVQDLRSQYELHNVIQGWCIANICQDSISIEYRRNRLGPVRLVFSLKQKFVEKGTTFMAGVTSLLIDSTCSRSPILQRADTLVKPVFKSLPKSLQIVFSQLDQLTLLDRELDTIVGCDARILDDIPACVSNPFPTQPLFSHDSSRRSSTSGNRQSITHHSNVIPIELSFFSYEARCKFDIIMLILPGQLHMGAYIPHYGDISEQQITQIIEEVIIKHPFNALSQVINAIQSLITSHVQ